MPWLFYAVIAYGVYSICNFIDKFVVEKKIKNPSTVAIFGGLLSLGIGLLLLAFTHFHLLPGVQIVLLLISGIFLTFYIVPYFKALSLDDASRVTPLFQFFPIFVLIISFLFLHESLTIRQFIGFIFVSLGGFLLGSEHIEKKLFRIRKSFWYMLFSSFLYALTSIIFKYVAQSNFWVIISYQTIGIGIGALLLLLYPIYKKDFISEIKRMKRPLFYLLLLNHFLTVIADFLIFYAITLAPVALVSVVQGVQPLYLIIFGLFLTLWFPHIVKEDIRKETIGVKVLSSGIIFLGLYFLYL